MRHRRWRWGRLIGVALLLLGVTPGLVRPAHADPRAEPVDLAAWQACVERGMCRTTPLPGTYEQVTARMPVAREFRAWPDRSWAEHPQEGAAFRYHTWIPRPRCRAPDGTFAYYPAGAWRLLVVLAAVWDGGAWRTAGVASGWGFLPEAAETCGGAWQIPNWETDTPPWPHPQDPPPGAACGFTLSDGIIPGVPLRLLVRDPRTGRMDPVDTPYWVTHGPIHPPPGSPPHRAIYPNQRPWAQHGAGVERLPAGARARVIVPPGFQLVAEYDFPRTRFSDPASGRWVTVGAHNDPRNMALVIEDLGPDRAYATPDDRFLFAQFLSGVWLPDDGDIEGDIGRSRFGPLRWLAWQERGVPLANTKVLAAADDWPQADLYGMSGGSTYPWFRAIHDPRLVFIDPPAFCRDGVACVGAGRAHRPRGGDLLEGVHRRDPANPESAYVFAPVHPLRIAFPVQAGRSYRVSAMASIERCRTHPTDGNVFYWFSNATQIMVDVADGGVIRGRVLDVSRPETPTPARAAMHRVTLTGRVGGQEVWLDEQATDADATFALTARLEPLQAALARQGRAADDSAPVTLHLSLSVGQPADPAALRYALTRTYPAQAPQGQTAEAAAAGHVRWTTTLGALRQAAQEGAAFFVVQVPRWTPPAPGSALALHFRAAETMAGGASPAPVFTTLGRTPATQLDWWYGAPLLWRPIMRLQLPEPWERAGYRVDGAVVRWRVHTADGRALGDWMDGETWHRLAIGRNGWRPPDGVHGIQVARIDGAPTPLRVDGEYRYWLTTPWGVATEEQVAPLDGMIGVIIHTPRIRP
jgi:hypothetical protein